MSARTRLGLDWIDLLLHVGATIFLMIVVASVGDEMGAGPPTEAMIGLVGALSVIVLAVRRRRALDAAPRDDSAEARLAEVEDRLHALEHGQERLYELEERLEFAERLLAQHQPPERLPSP